MRVSPTYAVIPGMPSAPRYAEAGARSVSTTRTAVSSRSACSRQPSWWTTVSPTATLSLPLATTSPTAPPSSGASTANGVT